MAVEGGVAARRQESSQRERGNIEDGKSQDVFGIQRSPKAVMRYSITAAHLGLIKLYAAASTRLPRT